MNARDVFRLTTIAAALAAALGPAHAAEVLAGSGLNLASDSVSIGLGYTPDSGRRFGQYTGVNENGFYGLLDFNLVKREDETGAWTGVFGRNIGLDSPQLRLDHSHQGDYSWYVELSRITRHEPLQITTGVTGIGTTSLTIPNPATAGSPVNLKMVRDAVGLGFDKFLSGNWDMQVRFRNEQKEGARLSGRGDGSIDFAPEPINATTRQLEAKANYTGSQLQLSGGYYGTMYNNEFTRLDMTGGFAPGINPIGLPPDNQSHQLYLTGGYGFTPTTRGNFKVAYARATQEDSFIAVTPVQAGIGTSLDARVDTTLVQGGITSRPMPKLTLLADLRYEDRDDKTPVRLYLTPGTTTDGTNEPRSITTTTGKAEASYALPNAFRLTGGIGYEEKKRNTSAVRSVSFRESTDELSYRMELRRMMTETVTGALAYVHSERDGSSWATTTQTSGATGSNLIAPIHLADRTRDKVRLSVNWAPIEPLTLNLFVEEARDDYSPRDGSTIGPMEGTARNYSLDVGYVITQQWQVNAWYSRNDTKAEQTTCSGGCGTLTWAATLKNLSDNFGAGMRGKPIDKLQVGADLSYSHIKDEYRQEALIGAPISSLPDVTTKLTRLNLFGRYALDKNSGVRVDYIYDRFQSDDWTWTTFLYADGTRVTDDPNQTVNFVGVTYYYRWH